VHATKELFREVLEIYNLYMQPTTSDMHSHFQYILVNHTDTEIYYRQENTGEKLTLSPEEDLSFSFTNPYQPKLLGIVLLLVSLLSVCCLLFCITTFVFVSYHGCPCSHYLCVLGKIEITLSGWKKNKMSFSLDDPGTNIIEIEQADNPNIKRKIIINIKPTGEFSNFYPIFH